MITIPVKQRLKHQADIFLEIVPSNIHYVEDKNYLFQDFINRKVFHKVKILQKITIYRSELKSQWTFLNNAVNVEMHNQIDALYKEIKSTDLLDILILKSIVNLNPIEQCTI